MVIEERAADLQGDGPGGGIQLLKDGEQILGALQEEEKNRLGLIN